MEIIHELKKEGFTLTDIKRRGEDRLIEIYESILNKWGFSDYEISKMENPNPMSKDGWTPEIRKMVKMVKRNEVEEMTENLRWWYSDKVIELYVLKYIQDRNLNTMSGLNIAFDEMEQEMEAYRNSLNEMKAYSNLNPQNIIKAEIHTQILLNLTKMSNKLGVKQEELMILQWSTYARMAEISSSGKYGGLTKEQWLKQMKSYVEHKKIALESLLRLAKKKQDKEESNEKPLNEKESNKRTSND